MSKKKNMELKIYELLGIKTFRKLAFKLRDIFILPFTLKMTKEERQNLLYERPSNYIMKKGNGIKDLQDFKKQLLLNTGIHLWALSVCIPSFLRAISNAASLLVIMLDLTCIVLNFYCVMLQRYNHIRINEVIKKNLSREEAKKDQIKEELKKEDSLLTDHTYTIVSGRDKEKNISFQEFLDLATYSELKRYRNYLGYIKVCNQILMREQDYYKLNDYSFDFPLQKNKSLKLELKPKKDCKSPK